METVAASVIKMKGSLRMLEKCKMESYVTSTGKKWCFQFYLSNYCFCAGNLEIIFKTENTSYENECFGSAENLSGTINNQGDENFVTITDDPVISFLTAGSVLEAEVNPRENKAKSHLPSLFILVSAIIAVILSV